MGPYGSERDDSIASFSLLHLKSVRASATSQWPHIPAAEDKHQYSVCKPGTCCMKQFKFALLVRKLNGVLSYDQINLTFFLYIFLNIPWEQ